MPSQSTQDHYRGPWKPHNRAYRSACSRANDAHLNPTPVYLSNYLLLISALLCITFRTGAVRGNTCFLMKK